LTAQTITRARGLAAGAPTEALVLAAAVPPLFLHATYQPHVSIDLASTSVDVTLADAAVAAVLAAAIVRARREGWAPLWIARVLLAAAGALTVITLFALATPSLLDEDYGLAPHLVSALKFAWYALLLPATLLLVRSAADATPLFRATVVWSGAATAWGLLQFLGIVAEFEGKRPGQREPSFVGIHDFAALSAAALLLGVVGVALADGRPLGVRRWAVGALAAGGLGVVLSGAMTAVVGLWLAVAALLLITRPGARRALGVAAIALVVTAGTASMRAEAIERFAEFVGIRDRVENTGVQSYAHRTLLAYIGFRIWLDHPVTGVGWQASNEPWASAPYLDDARRRFPDEPAEAFPSAERRWGVQTLYLQVLADLGLVGFAALATLFGAAVVAGVRGARRSPVPLVGLAWLLAAAGVWAGIGIVPGLPLTALTWLALGLAGTRA
jgi:O-antigen ligase/polysaccharide polymerase Wzy-like membrane protein